MLSNFTMQNKALKTCLAAALLLCCCTSLRAADYFLFAYFKEPAKTGIYYALSTDGYRWTPVNDGNPIFSPQQTAELMRDIFITRGPDHEFHAVWTWGWREKAIGYAHSNDLVHWSKQIKVPLMVNIPNTIHTWAPEIYWDKGRSEWLIIWSSIAEGQTRNRIYSSFTHDFVTFTSPAVFFDPGYDVIDATILRTRGRYYLIFKDQTKSPLTYKLRMAQSRSLEGPWSDISSTLTESWSEGPSALKIGRSYFIYYDHYRPVPGHEAIRYEALRSSNLKDWVPIGNQISFPKGCKHGSFLKLTRAKAKRLKALHAAANQ
jgi:hypothetical protein